MNTEAFVYEWINLTNGKSYIGYHKGSIDDGYISSSRNDQFWNDFYNPEMKWNRKIIFIGLAKDCLTFEQQILKDRNLKDECYYNNAKGAEIIFTDDVREKMSQSAKRRWLNMSESERKVWGDRISKSKLGVSRPKSVGESLSKLFKGKSYIERYGEDKAKLIGKKISESNAGQHYHSEEHKKTLSLRMKDNSFGKNQSAETRRKKSDRFRSDDNPGKNKTAETKKKISESKKGSVPWNKGKQRKQIECPHCNTKGGNGVMQRWHFNNCKYIKHE